jgi:hypothetical protein
LLRGALAHTGLDWKREIVEQLAGAYTERATEPEHGGQSWVRQLAAQALESPHRDAGGACKALYGQRLRPSQLVDPGDEKRCDRALLGVCKRARRLSRGLTIVDRAHVLLAHVGAPVTL